MNKQSRTKRQKRRRSRQKVITPADALAAYERAFRLGSPWEVEKLLREMLNVQVAVVDDKERAEAQLREGKRLKTVSVPYGVFLNKIKGKKVYLLDPTAQKGGKAFLDEAVDDDIAPNRTYVLLASEAGYHPQKGLTFEGQGQPTGFEDMPDAENREKRTEGKFQTWSEHTQGVWERSQRIVGLYRPFIECWAEKVLGLEDTRKTDFVDTVLWAMRAAVLFHDIGKLNQNWQDIVWKNEQKISNQHNTDFIARTSPVPDEQIRSQLKKPPYHAPFAYPFVKTFLRKILGDYRFLDTIALAAARHHSLEVSGAIKANEFQWAQLGNQSAQECLNQLVQTVLGSLSDEESRRLEEALQEASNAVTQSSQADEPPGPTDDFYFLYCLTNRLVKVCDWEDAGDTQIELR